MTVRRRTWLIAGAVVVGLAIAAVASTRDHAPAPVAAPPRSIAGFTVAYQVETHAQGTEITQRQVAVRRPYDSSDLTTPATGTGAQSGFISQGTHLFQANGTAILDYGDRVSGEPPGDYRLFPIIPDLVRLDLARRTSTDHVAGRPCTVYRFGQPLGDPIRAAKAGEYADVCIDRAGIVLSQRWFLKGKLLQYLHAERVDATVPADAALAVPDGPRQPNPTGAGAVQDLGVSSIPTTGLPYWVTTSPPWGFRLAKRTRGVTTNAAGGTPEVVDIVYVDSYVRGTDVIDVVHRELAVTGPVGTGVEKVKAGRLGTGQVTLSDAGASIAFTAGKWVVTVQGPLDVAHLRAFSELLRPVSPPKK